MMDLTVTVRLIDQLSAPARETAHALTKIVEAAEKLSGTNTRVVARVLSGISRALGTLDNAKVNEKLPGEIESLAKAMSSIDESGVQKSAKVLRSLGSALTAIEKRAPKQATTSSIIGFCNAISGISSKATEISDTAKGLSALSRSVEKISGKVGQMKIAADGIEILSKAISHNGGSAAASINTALNQTISLQQAAIQNMTKLANAGGGGRRGRNGHPAGAGGGGHGGNGGGGMFTGMMMPSGHDVVKESWAQATGLEDANVRMRGKGLSQEEMDSVVAKAQEITKNVAGTTVLSNINGIMEGYVAMGGKLNDSIQIAETVISTGKNIAFFSGSKDRALDAQKQIYDLERSGELRGIINDKKRFRALLAGFEAVSEFTDGKLQASDFFKNIMYGRSAMQAVSDKFLIRSQFLNQELKTGGKGGSAGTALAALYRAIPLAVQKLGNLKEWRRLGFVDESKVEKKNGRDVAIHPGAITLGIHTNADGTKTDYASTDPDKAVNELNDRLSQLGITDRTDRIKEYAGLVGTGTGQTALDVLGMQSERMERFNRAVDAMQDTATIGLEIDKSASQSVDNLNSSFQVLSGTTGTFVIPAFTNLVNKLNWVVSGINSVVGYSGGNDPTKTTSMTQDLSLISAATLFSTGAYVFLRAMQMPMISKLVAFMVGNYAVGPVAGVVLSASTGKIAEYFATVAGAGLLKVIGGGAFAGAIYLAGATAIDKIIQHFAPMIVSPERAARSAAFNEQWTLQKWGLFGGSSNPMDPRFAPPPGTPLDPTLDGKRERGGPVDQGKTYLVGERGPELFTPGQDGQITSNGKMKSLLSGNSAPIAGMRADGGPVSAGLTYLVGERGKELFTPTSASVPGSIASSFLTASASSGEDGGIVARALRFMSFDLIAALNSMLSRLLGRMNAGRNDDVGSMGDNTFYGGTSAAGGAGGGGGGRTYGGGGRRGFMQHGAGSPEVMGRQRFMQRGAGSKGGEGDIPTDANSVDVATSLLKKREGFTGHAKWDVNHQRLGYGSDTITDANGNVREVQAGDTVSREDAERDLKRRIPEFQRKVAKEVGTENWQKLSPTVQGALTSMAYNYGGFAARKGHSDYMKPLRDAIASGDNSKIAAAIRQREGDNGGINAGRREEEAQMVEHGGQRTSPPPGPGTSSVASGGDVMGRLQDARRKGLITNKQCVSLATAAVGLHPGMAGNNVKEWRKGDNAADGTLKPGTPLATFLDRAGNASSRYAGGGIGTMGAHLDHAGVFESYIRDKAGKIIGMNMAEQFKKSNGIHSKAYMFNNGKFGEANGSNYNAIKGADGRYIGGAQNPMNAQPKDNVPSVLRERAKFMHDERERQRSTPVAANTTTHHHHNDVGGITVNAQPHHNERNIADLVHKKFNDSVRSQLSDGAYS